MVVGFWWLIPVELASGKSSEQDTATVTKDNEEPAENQKEETVVEGGELAKAE